jgi:hypothetical protein
VILPALRLLPWGAALLATAVGAGAPAPAESSAPAPLQPGVPMAVYVAPGRATTILLQTAEHVAAISLASPVVTYKYDKALNQLELTPTVRTGGVETNLNLRIGPNVYVLLVKVVNDVRAEFLRSFTLAGDASEDDEAGLAGARPLPPSEIDLVSAAQVLERAETDPVFRQSRPNLKLEALNREYAWNECAVTLTDLGQFLDADLLVFRVRWLNRTDEAIYLDPSQYTLLVAGQPAPIAARYKVGTGPVVYPGQLETVYLAVQGYRFSRHNQWDLGLPPESAAVVRLLSPSHP